MSTEKKPITRTRRLAIIALVSLLALLFTYLKFRHVTVPHELVGTWRTTNAAYAEHPFEIGLVSINFGTGTGTVSTGFIDDIKSTVDDGKTLYTIFYSVDGTQNQTSFYFGYDVKGEQTIQFRNQAQIVWKKDDGS
ncbi:MAG TPA: hypothetical protein VN822_07635 [Candidatus Acidoferrales bacterium]|nr:hypothetical protein [Candidatus Acidoferrales bacterium]